MAKFKTVWNRLFGVRQHCTAGDNSVCVQVASVSVPAEEPAETQAEAPENTTENEEYGSRLIALHNALTKLQHKLKEQDEEKAREIRNLYASVRELTRIANGLECTIYYLLKHNPHIYLPPDEASVTQHKNVYGTLPTSNLDIVIGSVRRCVESTVGAEASKGGKAGGGNGGGQGSAVYKPCIDWVRFHKQCQ